MTRTDPDQYDYPNSAYQAACDQIGVLRAALESIARNTCCDTCREAALVAQKALGREAASPRSLSASQDEPVTDPLRATTESGGISTLTICTTTCFECGHDLEGPWCPACNPPSEWRPIESAPRDGRVILAFGGGLEGRIDMVSYNLGLGCWDCSEVTLDDRDGEAQGYSRPTHWMPLPDAPR